MAINTIYKYDIANIFKNGILNKDNNRIEFTTNYRNDYEIINISDCFLIDQIKKVLKDVDLKEVLVMMDFSNFKNDILKLQNFENGIVLNIDGKLITFKLFIKSSLMSRSFTCFYINEEYKELIEERINLGFSFNRLKINNYNYLLGLSAEASTILDDIDLDSDEVAIIPDKKESIICDCITAISTRYILSLLDKYINNLENKRYSNKIKDELNHYIISKDFENIDIELQNFIKRFLELYELDFEFATKQAKILKEKYIYCKEEDIKWFNLEVKHFNIDINPFNGVGLIEKEFASIINNKLKEKGILNSENSFNILLPYLNGLVYSCDFKSFFKDKNILFIKSIINFNNDGYTFVNKDVNKLKLIISESIFKASSYLKRLSSNNNMVGYYFELLNKYNYHLAIKNNINKEDKGENLNYQFFSTLPVDNNDINYLIEKNKNYIKEKCDVKNINNYLKEDNLEADYLIYSLFRDYYLVSERYKSLREDLIQREKNDVIIGKLKVDSKRVSLTSDLLSFLYYVIDKEMNEEDILDNKHFYCPISDNEYGIILRSPSFSRNEIVVSKLDKNSLERNKYFSSLVDVLMVNPTSLYLNRLGLKSYNDDNILYIYDSSLCKNMYDRLINEEEFIYKLANIPSMKEETINVNYKMNVYSLNKTLVNNTGIISNIAIVKNMEEKDDINDHLTYFTILSALDFNTNIDGYKPLIELDSKTKNLFIDVKTAIKNHAINDDCYITNKKTIREITKKQENHYIYKIMHDIIIFNPKKTNVLKQNNYNELLNINNDFDIRGRIIVKSIIAAYNKLSSLNRFCAINSKLAFTNIEVIKDFIKDIILDVDVNEFLSYFKSNDSRGLLIKYLRNHYHFFNNYEDKVNFIKNELGLNLPSNILEIVTNFKDRNYCLLYCCLVYWKEMEIINYSVDVNNIPSSKEIELLNNNDKEFAYSIRNKMIDHIINIKPLGEFKYDELLDLCKNYIKETYPSLTFNEVGNAIDLLKDSIQYDLFDYLIISYYKEDKE